MANKLESATALLEQQTALAKFGEFALSSDDLGAILQEACRRVCSGLRTDLAKVMELQDDGRTLLVRAASAGGRESLAPQLRWRITRPSTGKR